MTEVEMGWESLQLCDECGLLGGNHSYGCGLAPESLLHRLTNRVDALELELAIHQIIEQDQGYTGYIYRRHAIERLKEIAAEQESNGDD